MKPVLLSSVAVLGLCSGGVAAAQDIGAPPAPAVQPPTTADANEAAARVKQALLQAQGRDARNISVTVHGETLVLTGQVDNQLQASVAASTAQAAAQGARVSNQLEVRPPEQLRSDERREQQLVRDVETALRADPATANLGVAVSIDEAGVIGLHGLVPSRDSRAQAERVAARVTGAAKLRNHLAVPGER